jgi:hypothetical protein
LYREREREREMPMIAVERREGMSEKCNEVVADDGRM